MKQKTWIRVIFVSLVTLLIVAGCSQDPNVRKQKYFKSGNSYFYHGKYREAAIEFLDAIRVELIAPHRWNRSKPITLDGRVLRRYRRRWKSECLFAQLHNYRRVVIRWEYYPENFLGMVQLACAVILLRNL